MPDPNPIAATPDALRKTLGRRPVLWVGAGTSIAAGHPSTWALVEAMIAEADDPIDPALTFEQAADAFVASQGAGALEDLLQARSVATRASPGSTTPQIPPALKGRKRRLLAMPRTGGFRPFRAVEWGWPDLGLAPSRCAPCLQPRAILLGPSGAGMVMDI